MIAAHGLTQATTPASHESMFVAISPAKTRTIVNAVGHDADRDRKDVARNLHVEPKSGHRHRVHVEDVRGDRPVDHEQQDRDRQHLNV